jgi:NADH:ubiquinone oxidoreductase subunit 5 (subunit L)/multisubunit Na+/H+ antiporter MnhA subunit
MTLLYLLRVFRAVFLGEPAEVKHSGFPSPLPSPGGGGSKEEGTPVMVGSVVVLAALGLVAGIAIYPPAQFALKAVTQMLPGLVK